MEVAMANEPVVITKSVLRNRYGKFESADDAVRAIAHDEPEAAVSEALAQYDQVAHKLLEEPGPDDVMVAPPDQITALYQSYLSETAQREGRIKPLPTGGFEAQMDTHDFRWLTKGAFPWVKSKLQIGRCPWVDDPGPIMRIPNSYRIAVLGDWGTGMYGAPVCAAAIQSDGDFNLLLHLGDVYYTGTENETQSRFIKHWPQISERKSQPGVPCITRCLNGNHEMYSGGAPYFAMLHRFGQPASYFAMQNDYWLLVGLDTAYTEHQLHGNQVDWLGTLLAQVGARRVILFSHHQPFSLTEEPARTLIEQLSPFLQKHQIFAWYWGHEHICVLYKRHPLWRMYGRCVGHAGYPEFRREDLGELQDTPQFVPRDGRGMLTPPAYLLDGPNRYVPGHEKKYSPNGFAILELSDATLREEFYEPRGGLSGLLYGEALPPNGS